MTLVLIAIMLFLTAKLTTLETSGEDGAYRAAVEKIDKVDHDFSKMLNSALLELDSKEKKSVRVLHSKRV